MNGKGYQQEKLEMALKKAIYDIFPEPNFDQLQIIKKAMATINEELEPNIKIVFPDDDWGVFSEKFSIKFPN